MLEKRRHVVHQPDFSVTFSLTRSSWLVLAPAPCRPVLTLPCVTVCIVFMESLLYKL